MMLAPKDSVQHLSHTRLKVTAQFTWLLQIKKAEVKVAVAHLNVNATCNTPEDRGVCATHTTRQVCVDDLGATSKGTIKQSKTMLYVSEQFAAIAATCTSMMMIKKHSTDPKFLCD